MTTVTMRGRCGTCKRRVRVRKDGKIRVHYMTEGMLPGDRTPEEEPCPGSDNPPL